MLRPEPRDLSNPVRISTLPVWWWAVPILLLIFWLGARSLDADSLWSDEYFSIVDSGGGPFERRNPEEIWNGVASRNPYHVPGFFILLSSWGALTGWEPPILRALSLLAGVLAAAWTYRLGRDLLSARAGLVATAVVGTSALFVYYLHELRMYTLLTLFTTMTLWHYLYLMNPQSRPRRYHWAGLLVGAVAALYTQYFAIPFLGAITAYHVLLAPLITRWRAVLYIMLLAGLLFVPWLSSIVSGVGLVAQDDDLHEVAFSASEVVQNVLTTFSNGSPLLLALAGVAALLALVGLRRRHAVTVWFFPLVVLGLIVVVNAALELLNPRRLRYTIQMWPLLALLVSLGIITLERWSYSRVRIGRILAAVLLGAWLVQSLGYTLAGRYRFSVFPFHVAADTLRDDLQAHDLILTVSHNPQFAGVGSQRRLLRYYLDPLTVDTGLLVTTPQNENAADTQDRLLQSLEDAPRSNLWVLYNPNREPDYLTTLRDVLEPNYAQCTTPFDGSGLRIQEYARSSVCCSTERDLSDPVLRYTNGIELLNVAPLPETVAGDTLEVSALWHVPPDVPANAYSVSFQVYDAARVKVAQADVTLDAVAFACSSVDVTLPALDAGDYTVEAVVYAWETGERLTGTRLADGTMSDLFALAQFTRS